MTKPMMTALERLTQSNADKVAALMSFNPTVDYSKLMVDRVMWPSQVPLPPGTYDLEPTPFGWGVDLAAVERRTVTGRMESPPQMQEFPRTQAPKPNAEFVKAPLKTDHCGYMYYDPAKVRGAAKRVAGALPIMMAQTGADTVVVLGKSGLCIAYAALMLIDFPLVTVRRPGERPRGGGVQVEGPKGHVVKRYLILDDLVGSGGTAANIHTALLDEASSHAVAPECVGILCYDSRSSDYHIDVGRNRVPVKGTDEVYEAN